MDKKLLAKNYLKYYFNTLLGKKRPVVSVLSLTEKCNHRCEMCPISQEEADGSGDISTEEWEKIIDKISDYSIYMCLEGGEPTLRNDIVEIIEHAYETGVSVQLTTNGTLLHKVLPQVKGKLDAISVSLDTGKKSTYKKQIGVDTFDRVVKNVKLANDLGFHVVLNCVLTKYNVDEIISGEYFDFVDDLNVGSLGITLVDQYPGTPDLSASDEKIKKAMDSILKHIEEGNQPPLIIPSSYYESTKKYGRPKYDKCRVWTSLNVNNQGKAITPYWKFNVEDEANSLVSNSVKKVWENTDWSKCSECTECVIHCFYINLRLLKLIPSFKDIGYYVKFARKL